VFLNFCPSYFTFRNFDGRTALVGLYVVTRQSPVTNHQHCTPPRTPTPRATTCRVQRRLHRYTLHRKIHASKTW